jgi:hypothetical protein
VDDTEKLIREKALLRLSEIFGIPVAKLSLDRRFGDDHKVNDDIHDVADREITKEMASGRLTIYTVGDYCDHMVRCSRTKRKDVLRLLEIDENQGA